MTAYIGTINRMPPQEKWVGEITEAHMSKLKTNQHTHTHTHTHTHRIIPELFHLHTLDADLGDELSEHTRIALDKAPLP